MHISNTSFAKFFHIKTPCAALPKFCTGLIIPVRSLLLRPKAEPHYMRYTNEQTIDVKTFLCFFL